MASASFNSLNAKDKKEKKNDTPVVENKVELKTANDTLSYVSGMAMTNGLMPFLKQNFGVSETELPTVIEGFKSAMASRNDPKAKPFHAGEQIAEMVSSRMIPGLQSEFTIDNDSLNENMIIEGFLAALNNDSTYYTTAAAEKLFGEQRVAYKKRIDEENKAKGEAFLAENKTKDGVVTLPSGLQYKILTKGTGEIPKATDKVHVVYEGRTIDGKVFDATSRHGSAKYDTFTPSGLIKGWQEALTLMPVGSKWELYIPYELAYGERGAGREIAPYSALIFTMELQGIEEPAKKTEEPASTTSKPTTSVNKPTPPVSKRTPSVSKRTPSANKRTRVAKK